MDTLVLRKLPLIVSTAIYSALTMHAGLAYSAGIVTDGSTATSVTTVNQVDIVNIATPTAGGVSQNHFSHFSIDANGAVMNNSTVNGTSALAGQIQANSNLGASSARIILNEVTSNQQSNLNGTTEIFGGNARYILSNPNGITCNGCGFIRTPTGAGDTGTTIQDVFLTTGAATVNPTNGLPVTIKIDANNQSQIIIGQNGLDASNVDITTLLTRRTEINGIINAASKQLNVYLGKGTLSVNDNAASTWVADTSGNNINVAIDATSAGAMYAGQIFIQATEDGAGVTLPDNLVSTGAISISAAGDIVYRNASAQAGDVTVTTTGTNTDITSTGSTTASANVTLSATGDVSYNNATAQTGNVTVTTQAANAQITTSGNTTAAGNISWNMSGTRGRVTGTGGPVTFNAGSTILFNCTAGDGSCDIQSQRELILQAALLQSNANINTTSGNNLTVNAAVSTSQGFNSGANATFTSTSGDLNIAGNLIAANNIRLTSGLNAQIILDGNVQAGGNIAFLGDGSYTHDTVGTFNIDGNYQFDIFSLTNNAILSKLQNGTLRVNELTNNGLIENQAALTLKVDDTLINTGIIASLEGAVSIGHTNANQKTNSVTNSGVIASIDLTNSQLGQTGLILDPAGIISQHTQKILNGEQRGAEDLAAEIKSRNATLIAKLNANATVTGVVSINANTLTNTTSGRISGSDVSLLVDSLNNQGGQILAGRNLSIQGTDLSNTSANSQFGILTARDNLNISLSNSFTNTGLVDAAYITINAPTQNNTGSGFSIASLLGAKLDTTAQVNPLSQKTWFEAGTGNSQYQFINAFNNSIIDSNLTRLSDAFIQSSGATINANNQMVGDDVYIAELLVNTLRSQGGVPFVTNERDALGQLSSLYSNTQSYMTKTGVSFGQVPTANQQSQITAPILVFVAQDQGNGKQVFIPQVWMPTSGEGINAQVGRINTQIIAANDLLLEGQQITSHDADLIAGDNLVIEAIDLNISGEQRKWYVDTEGQVHYRTAQIVAGDSVLVKLSGNYVQEGAKVLAANQLVVRAKSIHVSNKVKPDSNPVTSFNAAQGEKRQLWSSLLGLGLKHAGLRHKLKTEYQPEYAASANMMAKNVLLRAEDDITLTRADIRSTSFKNKDEGKYETKHNPHHNNAGSLKIIADNGSINNLGSYLESDSVYMQAGQDITTKSLQQVQNNKTTVNGQWNIRGSWYFDDDERTYSQTTTRSQFVTTDVAEIKAGKGGLVQVAGNDINNLGGIIGSEASIVQQATGNITNKSLATRYLEKQTVSASGSTSNNWYGLRTAPRNLKTNSSTTKYNTAIQLASITAKGDFIQNAGNKIINVGSSSAATGNIIQTAKKGIENKNLLSSTSLHSYQRYIKPKGYGYGYDDDNGYNRYQSKKTDTNTVTTTDNANINVVAAGGRLIVNVEEGDYLNQGNISAEKSIDVSANNIINSRQVIGKGNNARVIDSGKVTAGSDIKFLAKNNIIDTAGRYDAKGNILFNAKEKITQNVIALRKDHNKTSFNWRGGVSGYDNKTSITNTRGSFNSGSVTSLQAGEDLSLTSSTITASDIELRGKNITLGAAQNLQQRKRKQGGTNTVNRTVNHDVVNLKSEGNILVHADKNLTTQGSSIIAGNQTNNYIALNAGGEMRLDGVNNETYSYYYHHQRRSWGRSRTTIRESQRIRSQGTKIAGENLFINANVEKHTADKNNNVIFVGSQLDIGNEIYIKAQGDVNVYAALNYNYDMSESRKKGFGGFSSSSKGSRRSQQLLKATELSSRKGDLSLLSGNNIKVIASNLSSGRNINLQAENDVLVAAAEQAGSYDEWSLKSGLFTGGDLYHSTEKREGNTTRQYIGSNLNAANDINIQAARAKVVGSTLLAANSIIARTDVGDLDIVAASSHQDSYQYEKEISVSLGDFVKSLTRPDKMISTENNRVKMTLAKITYDEVESKNDDVTQQGSVLQAGNNITLNAAGDLNIEASELYADADATTDSTKSGTGNINLTANGDINITEAKNRFDNQSKELHGEAELSVVVQHQAAEVVNALLDLDKAKDQLKKAKEDFRQYKKGLATQRVNLATLEQSYQDKEVGISYLDIQELREYIEDAAEDKVWYEAGVAAASLNVVSKVTLLIQQTAAAAQSAGTWGFNAGVQLDIDATKTQSEQSQTASVASIIQGRNITLTNAGDSLIQGSHLNATNNLIINTQSLSILASRDTFDSNNKTEHGHITIAQTVYGGAGGPTVNASFDKSRNKDTQITYSNSTLNAKNITLETKGDTTIRGGNVHATNTLIANVGKNLILESVQNRTKSKSNSFSISGGFGTNEGSVSSVNAGIGASSGQQRSRQTVLSSLTSGNTANITVKEHTQLTGALLATVDEDNNDLGNLNLTTNSFSFEDLSNTQFNNSRNAGLSMNVSVGASSNEGSSDNESDSTSTTDSVDKTEGSKTNTKLNTSSVQYSNSTGYSKTKTLATLGKGNITIANSDETTLKRLNRDTTKTNKDIYAIDRQQGNIDLTIDHRLFSVDGRNAIKEDVERTKRLGKAIVDVATMKTYAFQDTLAHIDETQKALDVEKAFNLSNGGKNIETLQGDGSTIEEKQAAITLYAKIYAKTFGVSIESANIIAARKVIGGTTYTNASKTSSTIDINDNAQRNATDYANAMGHEVTHIRIAQRTTRDRGNTDLNEEYAHNMGEYAADGMEFSSNTYNNVQLNRDAKTNTHTRTVKGKKLLATNNANWRANLKAARNGNGNVDYLLPDVVKKWRDNLNQYMDENRKVSASLKGDATGTVLSVLAAPADILADLTNVLITAVDISTDGMGVVGMFGNELQKEAEQNLTDMGFKLNAVVENREAIAASIVKTLKEYPERIAELDPSALRSLAAIVGEIAMPAGAIAKMKFAKQADVPNSTTRIAGARFDEIISSVDGKVVGNYSILDNGPLSAGAKTRAELNDSLAATFSGGRYADIELANDLIVYRAWHPDQAREFGAFWSLEKPAGSLQTQIDSALLPEWGKLRSNPVQRQQATQFTEAVIPKGTRVYLGEVGSQGSPWVGSGSQLLIKDGAVLPEWKIDGGILQ